MLEPMMPVPGTIDVVSPLPPVRSGISDYTVDLLPHLAALAPVRLVRLPGEAPAAEIAARWPLIEPAALGVAGAVPLFQMGNNQHHREVYRLAMTTPGVLTLHDFVLHHFHLGRLVAEGRLDEYQAELAADHGWEGEVAARAVRWGVFSETLQFSLPAHRSLLRRQRGILVHSRWAAERLAEEDPDLRVATVPMGIPLPPPPDATAALALRRRLGIPETAPLLGSFGFQTPMKRTGIAVRALARPELAAAHLLVVGEESPFLALDADIEAAGVTDRVHRLGFLPYAELEAAIAAADLCLNLRYPTAGETSASLLRVLALGRPCIVSDFAQFAELPDAVVIKVAAVDAGGVEEHVTEEAAALAVAVGELLAAPRRLRQMGQAARAHVARAHAPEAAAAAIVEACRAWATAPPPGDAPRSVEAPSTLTWNDLPATLEVTGTEAWQPGERRTVRIALRNDGRARWLAGERGEGGVALEIDLAGEERARPWMPLPRDLAPGEAWCLELELRRPLGPARLRIEPRVLGVGSFVAGGGPVWEREI